MPRSASGSRPSGLASRRWRCSNFDYASVLTESMLLGNVAVRSGQTIDYIPETGEISGSESASRLLEAVHPQGVGDLSRSPWPRYPKSSENIAACGETSAESEDSAALFRSIPTSAA